MAKDLIKKVERSPIRAVAEMQAENAKKSVTAKTANVLLQIC